MSTVDRESLPDARFGATAFAGETGELPDVFPREMGPNALRYLQEVVEAGLASDMVQRFEDVLAEAHGRRFCIAAPGCTPALFALFLGLDFEPGDEIIVSPLGDYGDLCGLLFEHYIPVFCDADPDTGLITAETIEPCITDRTRAILAVIFFGLPCDYEPIMALAESRGLLVIEDVCQSVLATCRGRVSGSLAHVATFSFDAEKTCGGDMGGAILLDDEDLHARIVNRAHARGAKLFPGFGRRHLYQGAALRMPQCTAATCLANWEILPGQVERRQRSARKLDALISDIPGVTPYPVPPDRTHTYWLYGFSMDPGQFTCNPGELAEQVKAAGIPTCGLGEYYVLPACVPFLADRAARGDYPFGTPPASRKIDYDPQTVCPNVQAFMRTFIRWFWTEKYTDAHVDRMASIIGDVCGRNHV